MPTNIDFTKNAPNSSKSMSRAPIMTTADPLHELLSTHLAENRKEAQSQPKSPAKEKDRPTSEQESTRYLSRLLSLSLSDLTTTEPQSLSQSSHSNLLSIQALSSRSHRSSTTSSDRLATLSNSLPSLERSTIELRNAVPGLDESAVNFATTYGRTRTVRSGGVEYDETSAGAPNVNEALKSRKDSQLLARQADKLQDILELPSLLRASIAAASSSTIVGSSSAGGGAGGGSTTSSATATATTATSTTNYTQALDLFTHIRRLQILYPDSHLIRSLQREAEMSMHDMTSALLSSLRSQNIRLAAAIRTIGWLRRVIPQLSSSATSHSLYNPSTTTSVAPLTFQSSITDKQNSENQDEDLFGPLFLVSRLTTFLSITTEALSPLRDLADQETEKRITSTTVGGPIVVNQPGQQQRRASGSGSFSTAASVSGQQTERYLKRYIEVFREHSFATLQMYRNIFPQRSPSSEEEGSEKDEDPLQIPSAVASFPLHLVSLLTETLQTYLPNVVDPAARESLLMQVLYAANSLGRLGADFTMMIALLDVPEIDIKPIPEDDGKEKDIKEQEPEWARVIKKHRIQAARLDALTANHNT